MAQFRSVPFTRVDITGGFWQSRQQINADTTLDGIRERFQATGRFDAFRCDWKPGMPQQPHYFWDSDIAKWIEAASYVMAKRPNPEWERVIDEVVDRIEAHQQPDGYFNIWYTVVEPGKRWSDRTHHELYCAGHLIEAAVAYDQATGKDKFLRLMCRYADYIERVFAKEESAAFFTPGHEEIELALVKLYRRTGEKRYLDLSRLFIDRRGHGTPGFQDGWANLRYTQDHLPVREQTTAEGHAVRAVYLYSGMADIARETGDDSLTDACRAIFRNIVGRRMYITGGIGSSSAGEAFTVDYDLPNLTAYAETCAAIGLAFFARRMLLLEADSVYADTVERAMYNGILSGVSLDGRAFFYENPLEIDPRLLCRDVSVRDPAVRFPSDHRQEVFSCSCCPPNLARFIASVGDFLYTCGENTVFVHQYMPSRATLTVGGAAAEIRQETSYPADGRVKITATGLAGRKIAVRIPGWCQNAAVRVNGGATGYAAQKGYAYIVCSSDPTVVELDFAMEPVCMQADPRVQADAGRVALQRGPLVYCLEAVDNGPLLRSITLDPAGALTEQYDPRFGAVVIHATGYRQDAEPGMRLYQPSAGPGRKIPLTFIPYYAFANRGESEMLVWVNTAAG